MNTVHTSRTAPTGHMDPTVVTTGGSASRSLVAVRQPPMRVNLRASYLDCVGPLVVRENQSRRDLTKIAQYEVLGYFH
jgi:hypothetical protein